MVSAAGADPGSPMVSVAIVGRPNAGKSTLFNRLIGDDRSVVHDQPGTTRDAIDTVVETELGAIRFVDTAGMRRRARIDQAAGEYYSLLRALAAVDRSDIALLVVDATVGVTHQDQRLAERVDAAGCPIVVLLNKWDLLDTQAREGIALDIERRLHFLGEAAVLRVSALSGEGGEPAAARAAGGDRRVPAAHSHPGGEPGAGATPRPPIPPPTACGCCTPPRGPPIRPRSPCLPTGRCPAPICATWSAASGSSSTWARFPSSCGFGAGRGTSRGRQMAQMRQELPEEAG